MKNNLLRKIIVTIIAIVAILVSQDGKLLQTGQASISVNHINLHGPYSVERVVDGDTMVLNLEGNNVKVRMLGIDTPESVHSDKSKNTKEGKQASKFVKDLLKDKNVYLEYDVAKEDKYGRTLAYVYLDDEKMMLNKLLIEKGLAVVMTIQPNSRYADLFYECQVKARKLKVGFWATGYFCD